MAQNVGRRGRAWFYRLDLPPGPDGHRHQKRVGGFRAEREARNALANASVAKAEGRMRHTQAKRFRDLASEWLVAVGPDFGGSADAAGVRSGASYLGRPRLTSVVN